MGQRLAIVGFIVALVVAIFAFTQQQQAVEEARAAQSARAEAQDQQSVALAQAQDAADQQQLAENSAATLVVNAQKAATAQANAQSDSATAQAQVDAANTAAARLEATITAQLGNMQSTAQAGQDAIASAQAESTEELATAQAQIDAQATTQTSFDAALGTATAQVDLAEFARQSAEDDRAQALTQAWAAATALADSNHQLATAQSIINGVTATPTPRPAAASATPATEPTTVTGLQGTPSFDLTEQFTSKDGLVGFKYPTGWTALELDNGLLVVGTSDAVLQRSEQAVPAGELEIQMLVSPVTGFRGLATGATAKDVIEVFYNVLVQQGGSATLADAEDVTIGGFKGAQLQGTDNVNDVLIITAEISPDVYVVTFSSTPKGGLPTYTSVINKLIATITYKIA